MIVLALIALGWWLAAPDRFTAAARTATGTGLRAAGTGAKVHWNGGRDGRALGRTERRDRWNQRGGWWRKLLGLEHGTVVTGKAVKGTGALAAAAVRPVPGAIRDGWRAGRDRHRARTAGRPVPVALDPPWWRRPVPAPVPVGTGQDSGGQLAPAVEDRTTTDPGTGHARCSWTVSPSSLALFGIQKSCGQPATVGPFCARHHEASARTDCADCPQPMGTNPNCEECQALRIVRGEVGPYGSGPETVDETVPGPAGGNEATSVRTPFFPDAPDGPVLDDESDIRARNPELAQINPSPLTEGQRRFWHLRDRGYPGALDQDGWPAPDFYTGAIVNPMPYLHPSPGTNPADTPAPDTNGAPMPAPTELRTHVAVQDFAQQINHLSENSDLVVVAEKARTVGEQSRAGGFGAEMDSATDSLEETARRFAASVDALREQAAAYGKTSLSVQGS